MSGIDWPGLLRARLGGLGLRPAQFWALTPAELALMLGNPKAVPPMNRARLEEMARAWPDGEIGPDGEMGRDKEMGKRNGDNRRDRRD